MSEYSSETSSEQEFECDKCPRTFESERSLIVHKTKKHQGVSEKVPPKVSGELGCNICFKTFNNRAAFNGHNKSIHEDSASSKVLKGKAYTCSECASEFPTAIGLRVHKSAAHTEKEVEILSDSNPSGFEISGAGSEIVQNQSTIIIPEFQSRKEKIEGPMIDIVQDQQSSPLIRVIQLKKSENESKEVVREEPEKDRGRQTAFSIPLQAIHPSMIVETSGKVFNFAHVKNVQAFVKSVENENVTIWTKRSDKPYTVTVHYTNLQFSRGYHLPIFQQGDKIEARFGNLFVEALFLKEENKKVTIVCAAPDIRTHVVDDIHIRPSISNFETQDHLPPLKKRKVLVLE